MSVFHFRYRERRRTMRVALSVPLTVRGQTENGEAFTVQTQSHSVNRDGALIPLEQVVAEGQVLVLVNEHTSKPVDCKVAWSRRGRDGKGYVGVEFVPSNPNYWHMRFPPPGARPLRRAFVAKASA